MNKPIKGIQHNSFYVKNSHKEKLSSLWGLSRDTELDNMYDFEFYPNGALKVIHAVPFDSICGQIF